MHLTTESCSFNHLPVELLVHTFSFLEPKDLLLTERVSKAWQEASNSEALWRRHCEFKYGKNYLASLGSSHPKFFFTLPKFMKFFRHDLKPLSIEGKLEIDEELGEIYRPEIHGRYLFVLKSGLNDTSYLKIIFDLIYEEEIQIPQFFKSFRLLLSTFFNRKQVFIAEAENQLIISEPPFDSKKIIEGTLLNVSLNELFLTSSDKRKLSQFNLETLTESLTMELSSPIQGFFASEFAHVACMENGIIIFYNPSDLSKNFEILDFICEDVRVNQKWLLISCYKGHWNEGNIFLIVYDFVNNKLYRDLPLPRTDDEWYGNIELCDNTFIFSRLKLPSLATLTRISIAQLETIGSQELKFEDLNFPLCTWHLSSFADRYFFLLSQNKICFTDFFANVNDKLDLNLYKKDLRIRKIIINGRFVVVEHYRDFWRRCKFSYCDLLASKEISLEKPSLI